MDFQIGDFVSRKSYHNDVLFRIVGFRDGLVLLQGVNVRLSADSLKEDLHLEEKANMDEEDEPIIRKNVLMMHLDRDNYFYIPGKILHIDGDPDYLDRCMNFYKEMGVPANGICIKENEVPKHILELLKEYRPDILVITGHDAYYANKNDKEDIHNYQNSMNFVSSIKEARKFNKGQDSLIIIAGACQSNYEELIKAGANFASSPKRINIHALDPAIIASSLALSNKNESINLLETIEKTKYGSNGIGGLITNGTMYVGFPR